MPGSIEKAKIMENSSLSSGDIKDEEWVDHSEKERARVLRKMDWNLLPFISLLYLLSFL